MADTIAHPELSAERITSLTRETNYGTWRFQKTWKPLYIADAEGCWITDGAGKRYLDFSSQLMCVNLGHKNSGRRRSHRPAGARTRLCRPRICDDSTREAERQTAGSVAGRA